MEMHCADGSPLKVEFGVAVLFLRSSAAQEQRQYLYQHSVGSIPQPLLREATCSECMRLA
jgi:hypothetical protein